MTVGSSFQKKARARRSSRPWTGKPQVRSQPARQPVKPPTANGCPAMEEEKRALKALRVKERAPTPNIAALKASETQLRVSVDELREKLATEAGAEQPIDAAADSAYRYIAGYLTKRQKKVRDFCEVVCDMTESNPDELWVRLSPPLRLVPWVRVTWPRF